MVPCSTRVYRWFVEGPKSTWRARSSESPISEPQARNGKFDEERRRQVGGVVFGRHEPRDSGMGRGFSGEVYAIVWSATVG